MRKDFVNQISEALKIKRKDLIEKDIILHQLLLDLSKNEFFRENFLFKGGTCLIKCYLGYFRFSEDIDFTWKNQDKLKKMSNKETRKYLSSITNNIGSVFEEISKKRGLDFKFLKNNRDYIELGGSSKTVTFKIWYNSEMLNSRSFIKVQINFVENIVFQPVKTVLKSLLEQPVEELKLLLPEEYKEYSEHILFDVYDIKEIMCEKIRAILTRKGVKARDFVDVYLISKKFNIVLSNFKKDIVAKIVFALNLYAKYRNNFSEKKKLLSKKDIFAWGHESGLLLTEIDEKEFYAFLEEFIKFLQNIVADNADLYPYSK